jgi:hypothetical protein
MLQFSKSVFIFLILILLGSCEDVITIKLKNASPQIVIEARISNLSDTVKVMLHKSTDYFTPKDIIAVSDGLVSISDASGNSFSLTNNLNGIYSLTNFHATEGQSYTLKVITGGVQYNATSVMPQLVSIDSLSIDKDPDRPKENRLNIFFKDPPGANYYQVKVFRNDSLLNRNNQFSLYSDKYYDGKNVFVSIDARRFDLTRFEVNDTLKVQLISIDKIMYNYYQILRDITDQGIFLSASTPSNPPNNLSNNALGYFATLTISERKIIVKQ